MAYLKLFHVLFVIIWMGTLLTLSRLLGYHVKLDGESQLKVAKIYKRIYYFVDMPAMVLTILLGLFLLINGLSTVDFSQGWFHMKLTFVALLVVCDVAVGKWVNQLQLEVDSSRGIKYKILHGFIGLFLIATLFSIYVLHVK